jgi:hypothetical protein
VPRTDVRAHRAASAITNFGFKRGSRIIELRVVLRFRSSHLNVPRALTNFGIGPLAPQPVARSPWRDVKPAETTTTRRFR